MSSLNPKTNMNIDEKLIKLKGILCSYSSCAIAFSSGVDSTFLAYVAKQFIPNKTILISLNTQTLSSRDKKDLDLFQKQIGLKMIKVDFDQFQINNFYKNHPNRCYLCKYALFSKIKKLAFLHNKKIVVDGTNFSDCNDYRPGIRALNELGIKSPLKMCGITKMEIRQCLKNWGISASSKPSSGCLATRIPYNELITKDKLEIIRKCEDYLSNTTNLKNLRVRLSNNTGRIEVSPEDRHYFFNESKMDKIYENFKSFGCNFVSLDLKGYRTGSLNEIINKGNNTI